MTDWDTNLGSSIAVRLDYYDQEHQTALSHYPTAGVIQKLVGGIIEIPITEFLTHFLFHRLRTGHPQYRSYQNVRASIPHSYGMLADFVKLQAGSLCMSEGLLALPPDVVEKIGESIGLSVMNRLHGVTEADWTPIRADSGTKILDYELASAGNRLIQLEAKGRVVEATAKKSSQVSHAKTSIKEKKAASHSRGSLRYGTITCIPCKPETLKCWLLDPVPDDLDRGPRDFRTVARLRFLRWILWLVSPRSSLSTALATRLSAVEALHECDELSRIPLTRADQTAMEIKYEYAGRERHADFFSSRSRVKDGPAGGVIVPTLKRNGFFFIGFREDLLELVVGQDFDKVAAYSAEAGTALKTIECNVPAREFDDFRIPQERLRRFRRSNGYVRFETSGEIAYTQEGIVFGVLPIV